METTSTSSNSDLVQEDDGDLTQLDRATPRKKARNVRKDAEIDLDQELGQRESSNSQQQVAPKKGRKRQSIVHVKAEPNAKPKWGKQPKLEVYIGAEVYPNRMYPTGCPSFQKLSIKLFKVESNIVQGGKGDKDKLHLVDSQFASNRDGFGFMLKNLTSGEYQL